MNPQRVYDLSFVSKDISESGAPEIVVSILDPYGWRFKELLFRMMAEATPPEVRTYLGRDDPFALYDEQGRFGYGGCARYVKRERSSEFRFEFRDFWSRHVALSLQLMFHLLPALFSREEGDRSSTESQYVDVFMCCDDGPHGHSVSGWVFPFFGAWLAKKAQGMPEARGFSPEFYRGHSFCPEADTSMEECWSVLAKERGKRKGRYCSAGIMSPGRFCLTCPGNACDMAIYPDGLGGRTEMGTFMVRFASHNLDTHIQQLTLLAGLSALVDTARKDNEYRPPE